MNSKFLLTAPVFSLMLGFSLPQAAAADRPESPAKLGSSVAELSMAQAPAVEGCRVLATIRGSSGYGKNLDWKPAAKASALGRATQMGATHVVWKRFYPVGAFNGKAVARAYNCESRDLTSAPSASAAPGL